MKLPLSCSLRNGRLVPGGAATRQDHQPHASPRAQKQEIVPRQLAASRKPSAHALLLPRLCPFTPTKLLCIYPNYQGANLGSTTTNVMPVALLVAVSGQPSALFLLITNR